MPFDVICGYANRIRVAWICLVLALLLGPGDARATYTYTDGSFGISINLPDNTSVSRIKSPAGETGTEIAQFTLPEGNVVGRVVVSDLPEKVSFDKAVSDIRDQLATDSKVDAEKITADKASVQGNSKNAMLLGAWDDEHTLLNSMLVVQGPSDQMLIMYVAVHDIPQEAAAKLTRQLAEGFTVLLQATDEERLQAAQLRGPQTLMDLVSPPPAEQDLWDQQYFLISSGKEPYGYIVISETLEERGKRPGLAFTAERWTFWPQGGGVEHESQTAFASWDLHDDEWTSRIDTIVQPKDKPAQAATSAQSVMRLGTSLMVMMVDPQSRGKPAQRVLPYPRTVIPQAWRWLLPRLLARSPAAVKINAGEWIALVTYSPVRRGLETQMFSRATHGAIHQVLQREGLYGVTENWQFAAGTKLKQISSTDLQLTPASQTDIQRLFGSRLAQWKDKVTPPPSTPQTKASGSQPAGKGSPSAASRGSVTGKPTTRPTDPAEKQARQPRPQQQPKKK